jgi:hypothetical protein
MREGFGASSKSDPSILSRLQPEDSDYMGLVMIVEDLECHKT